VLATAIRGGSLGYPYTSGSCCFTEPIPPGPHYLTTRLQDYLTIYLPSPP